MYDPEVVASAILDEACFIHRKLGPGMLESAYRSILAARLIEHGYPVEMEKWVDLEFEGKHYDHVYRADLVVASAVVVELKAQERLPSIYERQLFTYLKLLDKRIGFLINFGAAHLKDGIRRQVYRYVPSPASRMRINQQ